jgi:hypothetical protein
VNGRFLTDLRFRVRVTGQGLTLSGD